MGQQRIIAVVDDDASVRIALASLLRSAGFVVLLFASADELLSGSDLRSIEFLILDWRMPRMDGLELLRHLRAAGWRIPTIFLTAHHCETGRAQAVAAGAIAFLTKPFDTEMLLNAVHAELVTR